MSEIQIARDEAVKVEDNAVSIYHKVADWVKKYEVYLVYCLGVATAPLAKAVYAVVKKHTVG